MRVLYVDDDPTALEFVQKGLERKGLEVDIASDGQIGYELATTRAYEVLVLDVMLPDIDGFTLLRKVREAGVDVPILFLSARGETMDRVHGLEIGADDYLSKPFAFAELVARILAVARRYLGDPEDGRLVVADLVLDTQQHRVERGGKEIHLTPRQFTLLEYLMRSSPRVLSRPMILEKVWGYGFESQSNAIDVHVTALRKKIDADFDRRLIHTVKGIGYVLEARGQRGSGEEHAQA